MSRFVLSFPWGMKPDPRFGVKYDRNLKAYVYEGDSLPAPLAPYASEDFSLARWHEDELNGHYRTPKVGANVFTPYEHQKEAAVRILSAYLRGHRGFLEADSTGTGKTLSTLYGVSVIAAKHSTKRANLLIVCPKSVIPQWRQTIGSFPLATKLFRPLILNYQQLEKLLSANTEVATKRAKTAKGKRRAAKRTKMTAGKPIAHFDYIIFDESQYLKNYGSNMSRFATKIARLDEPYVKGKSPFVVFSTATPGSSPLNLTIMAGIVAPLLSKTKGANITPDTWGKFLSDIGFAVSKSKTGWQWASVPWFDKNSDDPKKRREYERLEAKAKERQRKDAIRIGKALTQKNAPFIRRNPQDIAGWPEQQLIPLPIDLDPEQKPVYEQAWSRFRQFLRLTPAKKDPKTALVETLRYRQKASLLKVPTIVSQIEDWVDSGFQVYVSCEFIETVDLFKELLDKKRITHAEISGRNVDERESERIKFQKGQAQVALCTVVAGISLHANESLPDGTKASSNERITVVCDIRQNQLDVSQALGRAHREGKNSLSYFPYFQGTVEERVVDSYVNKSANMSSMVGESDQGELMERIFTEAATE